ncbi:MAG: hypothetical protein FJ116_07075 [Deltaproteobacteria bacterium]|nr:hypothetical protein [Deltaproteobacteria bacterium]
MPDISDMSNVDGWQGTQASKSPDTSGSKPKKNCGPDLPNFKGTKLNKVFKIGGSLVLTAIDLKAATDLR